MTSSYFGADITELADALRRAADRLSGAPSAPSISSAPPSIPASFPTRAAASVSPGTYARQMLAARAKLGNFVDGDLFADPARDILLDLFVAGEEGTRISISSCCIAAAVPPTTALRWIGMLKKRGLVEETTDPADGRRKWLSLSPHARDAIEAYVIAASGLLSTPAG